MLGVSIPHGWTILAIALQAIVVSGFTHRFGARATLKSVRLRRALHQRASRVTQAELWQAVGDLPSQNLYKADGHLELPGGTLVERISWRQSSDFLELWLPLSDEIRVKREVQVEIGNTKLSLSVKSGEATIVEFSVPLLHPVKAEESSWFVESEKVPGSGSDRWLVVQLRKKAKFLNWLNVAAGTIPGAESSVEGSAAPSSSSSLNIGLGEEKLADVMDRQYNTFLRILQTVSDNQPRG